VVIVFLQAVDLLEITALARYDFTIGENPSLPTSKIWWSPVNGKTSASSLMIEFWFFFVRFCVMHLEYGWNDYEGIDVKGKTVVILVMDPGLKCPKVVTFK